MIIAVLKTFVFLFTYPGVFLLRYFANHLVDSGLKSTLQLISDINLNILILFDSFACEWINVRASFCFLFAFSNFFYGFVSISNVVLSSQCDQKNV